MDRAWTRALLIGVTVVVVALGAAIGFGSGDRPAVPAAVEVAAADATRPELGGRWDRVVRTPRSFTVADALGPTVALFERPDVPLAARPSLDNPTHEGLPVVFLVLDEQGPAADDAWLHVRVSSRPNHLTAFVRRTDVALRQVPNHVLVEVGARRVTVLHGDEVLLRETVAVGTASTPTPVGDFFVDGIVDVPHDGGPYGAFQVSVSGFSEVLHSFGGGVGQIALHGTNRPDLLGQDVSNGCVRMTNDAIARVAELAPLGTPVKIVP